MSLTGSCYCGAVEFTVEDDGSRDGVACHCRTCQKLHTDGSFNAKSEVSRVKVTKGSPTVYDDNKADCGKPIHRYFCGTCGSALFSNPDSMPGVSFIKLGALDQVNDFKLAAEIYVESALSHTVVPKNTYGQKHFEGMMAKEV